MFRQLFRRMFSRMFRWNFIAKIIHWSGARALAAALLMALCFSGCSRFEYVSTRPLDEAGFGYSAIQDLRALDLNGPEVAELVKTKRAGISDESCVELLRVAHGRRQRFTSGAGVAQLRSAGLGDAAIVELVRLGQLGTWTGDSEAIRLAGISDRVVLAVARRRAAGKPALSGASLTHMKNAGVGEPALYELAIRGITDADAKDIARGRVKRGVTDAVVLRAYPAR
jgi:hypothetical protein